MATIWYVFLSIVLLGVMIFTHELGHFVVGRVCGFAIEEFSIGFGWKILGWRRKEIDYSLRVLPLGGYVRFTGEDEASDNPRAFNNMPVWKRMLVAIAGVSMNFITAFVAIVLLFSIYGAMNVPVVTEVENGSAAAEAGLMPGDQIIWMDGMDVTYDQQGFVQMYNHLQARQDATPIEMTVLREGTQVQLSVIKRQAAEGEWKLGVVFGKTERVPFPLALRESWRSFVDLTTMLVDFLRNLIFKGEGVDQVAGPVGMVKEVSTYIREGFDMVLSMFASISVNLGIMNLLPIPGLDGGRLLFLLAEGVRRKPLPRDKEGLVNLIGLGLMMLLMAIVMFRDVIRLF